MHHLPTNAQGSRRVSTVFDHLSSKWIRVLSKPVLADERIGFLVSLDTGNAGTKRLPKRQKWIYRDEEITVADL